VQFRTTVSGPENFKPVHYTTFLWATQLHGLSMQLLFVHSLFNDAVISSDYRSISANGSIIKAQLIGKEVEGSRSGLI
jgi:hypothetical protein